MDLVEAGGDVGLDQHAGVGHRFGGRVLLPGIRAKMITAQDQPLAREPFFICQGADVIAVLRRGHAGVAAELVDLVGGGLDQQHGAVRQCHVHGGAQHLLVAAADAVQADVGTGTVGSKQGLQRGHGQAPDIRKPRGGRRAEQHHVRRRHRRSGAARSAVPARR
ncbi:hypothetical protein G6F55_013922 [Rhizopus delemar]|nr:hypothetical protein G6F55_013922 [Rhizopus delemar]